MVTTTLGQLDDIRTQLLYEMGKVAAADPPVLSYSMAGRLYLSKSGWILLSVPNALVRGIFDTIHEGGVELPPGPDGVFNAHISVIPAKELESIGGPDMISERGHMFHYTLGPLKEVQPATWDEISRVWLVEVRSPELEKLRKSYGLTALPNDNQHKFHITVAVRRKKVLQENDISKA